VDQPVEGAGAVTVPATGVAAPAPEAEAATVTVQGLTAAEVAERVARGQVNDVPTSHTRSVSEILRANILTPFNALLGGLLVVILVVGPYQDALFGLVLIANAATGIVQELRAKRTLDSLSVLTAPGCRVLRDGELSDVARTQVVLDDVVELRPGDQVVVDAVVLQADTLELDESLLTGETLPVAKQPGDEALSGSFVVAGTGLVRASRVGQQAYAQVLEQEASRFSLVHSELQAGVNRIIRYVAWAILPTASLLLYSQLRANATMHAAARGTVAGVVAMVPEGLVLLTSVAFAVGVVRLARHRTLVQELPAVETLARVDVLCLDKTGTLTRGELVVTDVEALGDAEEAAAALGALAAAEPSPNPTLAAVARHCPPPGGWVAGERVPFSSARKFSAADFGDRGVWILGAPEVVMADGPASAVDATVARHAEAGGRVLLLARVQALPSEDAVPSGAEPCALVVLADEVRSEAPDTVAFFLAEGVDLRIISGDHPTTVGAVAARAGVPLDTPVVDARELGEDPRAIARAVARHRVFGRVTPQQKRIMVKALQRQGHVVAMTGDGVNDVLALKDADIGVAMGSGSSASRGAAQLILLDDSFAALPVAVAEGRRVIGNIERVANLFVVKTVYSMLLALATGVATLPFPFLPRHLTLVGSLTIGIPAFFLALAPNTQRARPDFIARVLRFSIPVGALAAMATFAGYLVAQGQPDLTVTQARTAATIILLSVGLVVLGRLAQPLTGWRRLLILGMVLAFLVVLATPGLRRFFDLALPSPVMVLACAGLVAAVDRLLAAAHAGLQWWVATRPLDEPLAELRRRAGNLRRPRGR
jgi:cation-transporting P-type ATPase E